MSQSESPRDFYHRLENGLSPLIRLMLAEHLPKIGGRKWWEACVLSSLTRIQLEYVREPENLEQFDFPALVNIVHHNWRTLRPSLGIGNEFTNYLFSLKTLRNEVEHRPALVLDDERRRHLEQSARLAMRLLNKDETTGPNLCTPLVARSMRAGILASAIAVVGLGVLLLKPGDAVTVTPSEAADPAPAAARTAQAETKHITAGLASKLGSDRINVCMRYQRNDGTWSKRYTVYDARIRLAPQRAAAPVALQARHQTPRHALAQDRRLHRHPAQRGRGQASRDLRRLPGQPHTSLGAQDRLGRLPHARCGRPKALLTPVGETPDARKRRSCRRRRLFVISPPAWSSSSRSARRGRRCTGRQGRTFGREPHTTTGICRRQNSIRVPSCSSSGIPKCAGTFSRARCRECLWILKTVESTISQIRRRRARGTSGLWPSSP